VEKPSELEVAQDQKEEMEEPNVHSGISPRVLSLRDQKGDRIEKQAGQPGAARSKKKTASTLENNVKHTQFDRHGGGARHTIVRQKGRKVSEVDW